MSQKKKHIAGWSLSKKHSEAALQENGGKKWDSGKLLNLL